MTRFYFLSIFLVSMSVLHGCNSGPQTVVIVPPPPVPKEPDAIKKRSYLSGEKKVCIYSRMGNEEQIVINRDDICPFKR